MSQLTQRLCHELETEINRLEDERAELRSRRDFLLLANNAEVERRREAERHRDAALQLAHLYQASMNSERYTAEVVAGGENGGSV
jgi:hypothetical protein